MYFFKALNKPFSPLQRKGEMFIPHRSTVKITEEVIQEAASCFVANTTGAELQGGNGGDAHAEEAACRIYGQATTQSQP